MDLSWWEGEDEEPIKLSVIQPKTSGAETLPHNSIKQLAMAKQIIGAAGVHHPKKTGGKGAAAMADAYHERVEELTKEGKLKAEEEMVVCEFSDSGKGVKDFLDTVRQRDEANETNVAARTKGVVLCSPERAKLLRESGEYEKRVSKFKKSMSANLKPSECR